jgi:hypothetical protein
MMNRPPLVFPIRKGVGYIFLTLTRVNVGVTVTLTAVNVP